ncbi:MAG: PCRF domain-containing protein, partial [Anaerolineales bacterium]
MEEKLQGIEQRFEEIDRELAEVGEDYQRAAELGRERAELGPIVESYRRYRELNAEREQAQALLDSDDEEMRSLAADELARLESELDSLEGELKSMLLPSDPRDRRNVIMEIR